MPKKLAKASAKAVRIIVNPFKVAITIYYKQPPCPHPKKLSLAIIGVYRLDVSFIDTLWYTQHALKS